MAKTIVIFRKDENGVFALFPEIPADNYGRFCTCYQHIGQHSGADYHGCIDNSKPVTSDEYTALFEELIQRGYDLKIRKRATYEMHKQRRQATVPVTTRFKRLAFTKKVKNG